jgi:hypothetical protein
MEQNKKQMIFTDSREALDYLVNKTWDNLTLDQRKFLRPYKRSFNHETISDERIEKALKEFGEVHIKKEIRLSI